jgi:hypothetical protein
MLQQPALNCVRLIVLRISNRAGFLSNTISPKVEPLRIEARDTNNGDVPSAMVEVTLRMRGTGETDSCDKLRDACSSPAA